MKRFSILLLSLASIALQSCDYAKEFFEDEEIIGPENSTASASTNRALKIPDRQTISVPVSGVGLGMGWDSRRGEIIPNNCLDFAALRADGQTISMEISEVSDQSEMMESMNVSASVSAKSMFASGNAKTDFAKSSKMSSSTTTLLLRTTVNNGVLTIAPSAAPAATRDSYPAVDTRMVAAVESNGTIPPNDAGAARDYRSGVVGFKSEIEDLTGDPERFRDTCGDFFVASIYSGAEMFTSFSFATTSASQAESFSAEVQASVGIVSATANVDKDTEGSAMNSNMSMRFVQIGGGSKPIPLSRDDLQEKLRNLALEANEAPKFHTMEIRSYREIPGASDLIYASPDAAFEVVSDYYWFLASLTEEIEHVIDNRDSYYQRTGLGVDQLHELHDEIIITRRALAEIIDAYLDDRTPQAEILDAVNYKWFDRDDEEKYVLNFDLAYIENQESELSSAHPCYMLTWFQCVIGQIEQSVPYGNPNTLKLLLPMNRNAYGMTKTETNIDGKCESHFTAVFRNAFRFHLSKKTVDELLKASINTYCASTREKDILESEEDLDIDQFKTFVLEHNIAKQSRRTCSREPRDNECLTNSEIATLAEYIPVLVE